MTLALTLAVVVSSLAGAATAMPVADAAFATERAAELVVSTRRALQEKRKAKADLKVSCRFYARYNGEKEGYAAVADAEVSFSTAGADATARLAENAGDYDAVDYSIAAKGSLNDVPAGKAKTFEIRVSSVGPGELWSDVVLVPAVNDKTKMIVTMMAPDSQGSFFGVGWPMDRGESRRFMRGPLSITATAAQDAPSISLTFQIKGRLWLYRADGYTSGASMILFSREGLNGEEAAARRVYRLQCLESAP